MNPLHSLHRPFFLTLCAIAVLSAFPSMAQQPPSSPPPSPPALAELTPSFPAPDPALFAKDGSASPFRLLGVDILQGDITLKGPVVPLNGAAPMTLKTYWLPDVSFPTSVPIMVRFSSRDGRVVRETTFNTGPKAREIAWSPGSVYTNSWSVDFPAIAGAINGSATITLFAQAPGNPKAHPRQPLQTLRLQIAPPVGASSIKPEEWTALLGARAFIPLGKQFMLGSQAEISLPLPPEAQGRIAGFALISSYGYGSIKQGDPVAKILLLDSGGEIAATLDIASGVATARTDYDFGQTKPNHEKIGVASSRDADYLSAAGAPFQKHTYIGEIPAPIPSATSITIRSAADVTFSVYGIAVLLK